MSILLLAKVGLHCNLHDNLYNTIRLINWAAVMQHVLSYQVVIAPQLYFRMQMFESLYLPFHPTAEVSNMYTSVFKINSDGSIRLPNCGYRTITLASNIHQLKNS